MLTVDRRKSIVWLVLGGGIVLALLAVYFYYNPTSSFWFPKCPVKLLTGYSCPGCGLQRAFHELLHGNFTQALSYNYFFVLSIPYLLLVTISLMFKGRNAKYDSIVQGQVLAWIYVVSYCIWFVLRNILGI